MFDNFKEIEPDDLLPAHIKQATLSNIDTSKLIYSLVDLFLVKAGATMGASLDFSQTPGESPQHSLEAPSDNEMEE